MTTFKSFSFLAMLSVFLFGFALQGHAVRYTTKSGNKKEQTAKEEPQCTKRDIKEIVAFETEANSKNKKIRELEMDYKSYNTKEKGEEFIEEMNKLSSFFTSERYQEMKPVFARCDRKMPTKQTMKPFWML